MSDSIISPKTLETIHRVWSDKAGNFIHLVNIAGLDKTRDFRFSDLSGMDFSYCDLTGFDFTGSDLTGADFTGAKKDAALFNNWNAQSVAEIPLLLTDLELYDIYSSEKERLEISSYARQMLSMIKHYFQDLGIEMPSKWKEISRALDELTEGDL
jgi:Pentapeptide repeats (8 copies)